MNEFLKALAKYSIVFAVLLVFLLFGLGTALLTAPNYLSGFLRYACVLLFAGRHSGSGNDVFFDPRIDR